MAFMALSKKNNNNIFIQTIDYLTSGPQLSISDELTKQASGGRNWQNKRRQNDHEPSSIIYQLLRSFIHLYGFTVIHSAILISFISSNQRMQVTGNSQQ